MVVCERIHAYNLEFNLRLFTEDPSINGLVWCSQVEVDKIGEFLFLCCLGNGESHLFLKGNLN